MDEQENGKFEIFCLEDLENAIRIIKNKKLKSVTFVPILFKEKYFSDKLKELKELNDNGVEINLQYIESEDKISLQQVIKDEEFLNNIVKEIKEKNFSPLEKLIAVYDIVKGFKPHNLGFDERGQEKYASSRGLYEILKKDNKDIVCVGFASLMENLCYRLGLNVVHFPLSGTKKGHYYGHEINYIYLVDEKYGIDGYYTLDSTEEHGGKIEILKDFPFEVAKSRYDRFLLTTYETKRNMYINGITCDSIDEVLLANNPIELNSTVNKINSIAMFDFAEENEKIEQIDSLEEMDPELKQYLDNIKNPFYFMRQEDFSEFSKYTQEKMNRNIDKKKLLDAIINVKKQIYNNFSEQDYEDMKMMYSIYPPFAQVNEKGQVTGSLYGNEYFKYAGRRYLQLREMDEDLIEKQNPCLWWEQIRKYGQAALRSGIYTEEEFSKYIENLKQTYKSQNVSTDDINNENRNLVQETERENNNVGEENDEH